ncbi:MAG: hypothetical protein ABJ344_12150 [Sulfitobacter pontiacus]|uniref:hypothetical protein n=1 Tax=Sulfitobacter pontiacus TaxID=60137 RepID=UPI003296A8DC
MLNFLRVSVSAFALSAFVAVPVTMLISVDYAYAKNGNGGGNGSGNGNGGDNGKGNGGGKGNDKSGSKGGKGWGADKSTKGNKTKSATASKSGKSNNGKGLGRTIQDDFKTLGGNLKKVGLGGLFKSQKPQRNVTRSTNKKTERVTVTKSLRPPVRNANFKSDPLHPSNLGKLNGAINSSPNAKAAHIANGQYASGKGPVSLAAALAVADYTYGEALGRYETDHASAQETLGLVEALEEANAVVTRAEESVQELSDAQAILADPNAFTPQEVADAQGTVDAANEAVQELADAQAVLADPDAFTPEEVTTAQETVDASTDTVQQVEDAADFIDENPAPSEEEIDEANNIVEDGPPSDEGVIDAEDALLANYKGDLPNSENPEDRLSEEEQEVVDAVRDANPPDEVIEEALGFPYDEEDDDDDDVTIDVGADDAIPDEVLTNKG